MKVDDNFNDLNDYEEVEVGDLVRVRNTFVEVFALIVDIGETNGTQWVRVIYFDREEEVVHPTQIRRVR